MSRNLKGVEYNFKLREALKIIARYPKQVRIYTDDYPSDDYSIGYVCKVSFITSCVYLSTSRDGEPYEEIPFEYIKAIELVALLYGEDNEN